ncbi:hypothetical protein HK104_006235, partial [Borealophlyctis nickersoniae]
MSAHSKKPTQQHQSLLESLTLSPSIPRNPETQPLLMRPETPSSQQPVTRERPLSRSPTTDESAETIWTGRRSGGNGGEGVRSVVVDVGVEGVRPRAQRPRLKKSVQSMINAQRWHNEYKGGSREPGADPGINVNIENPHLEEVYKGPVTIHGIDYSSTSVTIKDLDESSLGAYMASERPPGSAVRWLNIQGLSYKVIKQVANHYHLHPLAVEDVFHVPQRIKADWYENHIYISMILATLEDDSAVPSSPSPGGPIPLRSMLFPNRPDIKITNMLGKKLVFDRPNVAVEQANFFLMRDGTVISIFQHEGQRVLEPIFARLHREGTLLRESEDASFLVFTLIDA